MSVYRQIKDKFIMKNAWTDWESYRESLTDLILQREPGTVAIIGAGRCNDIDLRRILAVSEKAFLLDIDEEAMHEALDSLPGAYRIKADIREMSLTGISETDIEAVCEDMLTFVRKEGKNITEESLRFCIMSYLDGLTDKLIKEERELLDKLSDVSPDVIVCCGVYSQLFGVLSFFFRSLLFSVRDVLPEAVNLENELSERLHQMNNMVIPVTCSALIKAAAGCVIFGNEYMPESPVEGAHQCIMDVRTHYDPEEYHLEWNFNRAEGITYDMLIQVCSTGRDDS